MTAPNDVEMYQKNIETRLLSGVITFFVDEINALNGHITESILDS